MPGLLAQPKSSPSSSSSSTNQQATSNSEDRSSNQDAASASRMPRHSNPARDASRLGDAPANLRVQMPVHELIREHQMNGNRRGGAGQTAATSNSSQSSTRNRLLSAVNGNINSNRSHSQTTNYNRPSTARSANSADSILNQALRSSLGAESSSRAQQAPAPLPNLPVQVTDAQLLTTSVLEQREREKITLEWIEKLADSRDEGREIRREELKRALTYLSRSSWLQVLEERHLSNKCAYPLCSKSPRDPPRGFNSIPTPISKPSKSTPSTTDSLALISSKHAKQTSNHLTPYAQAKIAASKALPPSAPRYRVSLKDRSITLDPSTSATIGPNSFCSNLCHKRAEWIKRWVLKTSVDSDEESDEEEERRINAGSARRRIGNGTNDILRRNRRNEIKDARSKGGRWERRMEEKDWNQIELLEDLEEKGQIPSLSKGGTEEESEKNEELEQGKGTPKEGTSQDQVEMSEAEIAARAYQESVALMRARVKTSNASSPNIDPSKSSPSPQSESQQNTSARDKVKQLIESLVITERYDPSASTSTPTSTSKSTKTAKSKSPSSSRTTPSSSSVTEDVNFDSPKPRRTKRQQGGGLDLDELFGFGDDQDEDDEDDELAGLSTNARISKSVLLTSRRGLTTEVGSSTNQARSEIIKQSRKEEEIRKASMNAPEISKKSDEGEEDENLTEEQLEELKKLENQHQELEDLFAIAGRERDDLKAKGQWD